MILQKIVTANKVAGNKVKINKNPWSCPPPLLSRNSVPHLSGDGLASSSFLPPILHPGNRMTPLKGPSPPPSPCSQLLRGFPSHSENRSRVLLRRSATASPPPCPFPTSVSGSWVPDSVPPCTPVSEPLCLLYPLPRPQLPRVHAPACPSLPAGLCSSAPLRFSLPACPQTRYPFTTSCPTHAVTFSARPQLPGGGGRWGGPGFVFYSLL